MNPYTDHTQSVSGTVAMAMATGACVVSTPYPFAAEALADGVGVLVPFRDAAALAETIVALLDDPVAVVGHNIRAYGAAQGMTWRKVGERHVEIVGALV